MAGPELVLLRFGVELLYLHGRQLITASVESQANYYEENLDGPVPFLEITQLANKIWLQRTPGARISCKAWHATRSRPR